MAREVGVMMVSSAVLAEERRTGRARLDQLQRGFPLSAIVLISTPSSSPSPFQPQELSGDDAPSAYLRACCTFLGSILATTKVTSAASVNGEAAAATAPTSPTRAAPLALGDCLKSGQGLGMGWRKVDRCSFSVPYLAFGYGSEGDDRKSFLRAERIPARLTSGKSVFLCPSEKNCKLTWAALKERVRDDTGSLNWHYRT